MTLSIPEFDQMPLPAPAHRIRPLDPAGITPETTATAHGSPVDPSGSPQPGPPDRHGLRQVTWGG